MRGPSRRRAAVALLFVACSVLAALAFSETLPGAPSGLVERLALAVLCAWKAATAARLRHTPLLPPDGRAEGAVGP